MFVLVEKNHIYISGYVTTEQDGVKFNSIEVELYDADAMSDWINVTGDYLADPKRLERAKELLWEKYDSAIPDREASQDDF